MSSKTKTLKIIPLGGLGEIGKNMMVVEYADDIIIIDCGVSFPEDEMLGIDLVIPDISYLQKNKEKIRAIVLTHGHEDHIGALPYVLKEINVPVYGTKLTLGLVRNKLEEHRVDASLQVVKAKDVVRFGKMKVEFINTSHSIADSVAVAIHSPAGIIIHTSDFKVDFTPIDGQVIDLARFAGLGEQGVLALFADSTNVERPGYTMSEKTVGETFERMFEDAKGRIIIASFASNIHRIQQVINAAAKYNRKLCVSGRSMVNVVNVATELGYLSLPDNMLVDIDNISDYPDERVVVLTTGSQGEPMSALARMASSEHRKLDIKPDDLVIISATAIPGNEKLVSKIINQLFKKGANVIYEGLMETHVSGHACQEELKLIHSLVKPKFFIPVHGEYRHLKQHARLAESLGMPRENILIADLGNVIELTPDSCRISDTVTAGKVLVDGLGIGDVGNIVLRDRKHLSQDGLMVVVVTVSRDNFSIISGPDIISRGFVYVRESEELMDDAKEVVIRVMEECEERNITDWGTIKLNVRSALRDFLYERTKRKPMILPVIMEI
ncbi:MAG: ribonuclease J [Caldicoprobacterales bacterium]|nr:ribonuclease J [Clostridiales bacterium]